MKTLRLVFYIIGLLNCISASSQVALLRNGSFDEGDHLPRRIPYQWNDCSDSWNTPIHQPDSTTGIKIAPYNGEAFLSMMTRGEDKLYPFKSKKNDYITQQLIAPLTPLKQYIFKGMFAFQEFINYQTSDNLKMNPVKLRIYLSNSNCDTLQLLGETPIISNTNWQEYLLCFNTQNISEDYNYIRFQAASEGDTASNGIILMDDLSLEEVGADVGYISSVSVMDTLAYKGDEIKLTPTKEIKYRWTPTNGLSCTYCFAPTAMVDETTTYLGLYEDKNGCTYAESFRIRIPKCEVVLADKPDKTFQLESAYNEPLNIKADESTDIDYYQWYPEELVDCADCSTNTIIAKNNEVISVTMTTIEGCTYTYTFEISIHLTIPNVITPNFDGKNDYFEIYGLPENSELTILDKNGREIFYSSNYLNNWDGTDKNGNEVMTDTYWYFLTLDNGKKYKSFLLVKQE